MAHAFAYVFEGSGSFRDASAPIEEPVACYGPIVMNTQEQLRQTVSELNNGTFIK